MPGGYQGLNLAQVDAVPLHVVLKAGIREDRRASPAAQRR
jgi:hypothetical protein